MKKRIRNINTENINYNKVVIYKSETKKCKNLEIWKSENFKTKKVWNSENSENKDIPTCETWNLKS